MSFFSRTTKMLLKKLKFWVKTFSYLKKINLTIKNQCYVKIKYCYKKYTEKIVYGNVYSL